MYKASIHIALPFIIQRDKGSRNTTRIVPEYYHLSCEEEVQMHRTLWHPLFLTNKVTLSVTENKKRK